MSWQHSSAAGQASTELHWDVRGRLTSDAGRTAWKCALSVSGHLAASWRELEFFHGQLKIKSNVHSFLKKIKKKKKVSPAQRVMYS